MPTASQKHRARTVPAARAKALEQRIHERIQKRLAGRVRDLRVSQSGNVILIEGRCVTYYSKQLATHAALGVIEDEQLENAIEVALDH